MKNNAIVVGDADILIALLFKEDIHYEKAAKISITLQRAEINTVFPNSAIAEAITTLQRKLSQPLLADILNDQYRKGVFKVEYIDEIIMRRATELYNPHGSKKNTFFDALVAATAKELRADAIFSFDKWYKKLGFTLVEDLKI